MKSLFFALLIGLVSLSSCEFFPGDGPTDPPKETYEVTTRFWASSTEYGQEQDAFKSTDDIYLNYTLKNETGKPVKWVQPDGGPFVGYRVSGAGIASNFYMVHPETTPTVMQEGV
ncbi:MAG TPA: hypothetical protein VEC36_02200, partial [Patescibacteria group bacterium]|nr:hypothetical protein [Patescibacteria group bacterium]